MDDDRLRCAARALRGSGEQRALSEADLLAEENGHRFHQGWHIGWVWGADDEHSCFLDVLREHRMAGIEADRVFPDGSTEPLDVPYEIRLVGKTPEEDAELERALFEHNQRAYASLRERGLLPPPGGNIGSQDINEFLNSGGEVPRSSDAG